VRSAAERQELDRHVRLLGEPDERTELVPHHVRALRATPGSRTPRPSDHDSQPVPGAVVARLHADLADLDKRRQNVVDQIEGTN
jgi:hypothetical protein